MIQCASKMQHSVSPIYINLASKNGRTGNLDYLSNIEKMTKQMKSMCEVLAVHVK